MSKRRRREMRAFKREHGESAASIEYGNSGLARLWHRFWRFEDLSWPIERAHTYLHRWWLLSLPGAIRTYLHHYLGSDWSRCPHDHPKTFWSIGLWGGYVEETYRFFKVKDADENSVTYRQIERRQYRAPWIRKFDALHTHRLRTTKKGCWTLCITGREWRNWGFWSNGRWIHWRNYIFEGER